jgi:hypothetical protein
MREKKTPEGKVYEPEYFEMFRPIAMANITGLDEVLSDRCISVILNKSNNSYHSKMIEDFENDILLKKVVENLKECRLCSVVKEKRHVEGWNNYINDKYTTNNTIYIHTYNTHTTEVHTVDVTPPSEVFSVGNKNPSYLHYIDFFNKIESHNIYGRNLEIFFPIFMIAEIVGDNILNYTIKSSSDLIYDKRKEESVESFDIALLEFLSTKEGTFEYVYVSNLLREFRLHNNLPDKAKEYEFVNEMWLGRALKRLSLVLDKKRHSGGIKVQVDIVKARQQYQTFDIK